MKNIFLSIMALILLASCSPIGAAAGAGAALGISAAREGGISSTASDLKIKALISDKWFRYDLGTFTKLNLTVNQGRVLITGVVQNPDHRVEAVRLAWQVEGVSQVINEIRVAEGEGLPGYVRDQWITTRLRTAMTFDRNIQSINYSIDTVAGTVYLMGVAQNQAELNKVIEVARTIPHVMQVVNYVKMAGETPRALQPSSQDNRNAGNSGNSNVMTAPTRNQTVESEELYWPDQ
ncbi:MAG: phospholipid-binding domain-containing protein [Alphaproteobacteria bacterium CG_4_9_14_3_um_filter_47_13]|nr:MAG: phospholipid-binding domain-containing protein [Alphaproteobacteria bacterium CG_4_9_14_3_um_filter_47_13]